jgi:hypothetical protein
MITVPYVLNRLNTQTAWGVDVRFNLVSHHQDFLWRDSPRLKFLQEPLVQLPTLFSFAPVALVDGAALQIDFALGRNMHSK